MTRIRLIGLVLGAAFALSGITASSSSAWCLKTKIVNTGYFEEAACAKPLALGQYTEVENIHYIPASGLFCGKTNEANKGQWKTEECNGTKIQGEQWTQVLIPGPVWLVKGLVLEPGKSKPITFANNGNTKLITASDEILCEKAEQTGTGNELIGGSPGTDKANIKFTKCSVKKPALGCEVKSKGTAPFGTIEVSVNTELVYTGTKAQAEKEEGPLGILFKTKAAKNKEFVELEFKGLCAFGPKLVEATGEEHGPGIAGVAGVVCNIAEKAEEENVSHEISCVEKAQQKFFYREGETVKEGKAGLKLGSEVAEQVGKGKIELESKEKYAATGK